MATKPITTNPVADLPTNWSTGQVVAPDGTQVGLTQQHGYNYQSGKINEALTDIGLINDAFAGIDEFVVIEYDSSTTAAQVYASIQDGKHPVLSINNYYCFDYYFNSSGTIISWRTVIPDNSNIMLFQLNGSSWTTTSHISAAYRRASNIGWNKETFAGSASPAITLPAIPTVSDSAEIRYVFTAASANATFTAPSGVALTDGDTTTAAGGALAYTNLTVGSIYECSFAVLSSTLIALVMKEWPQA